VDGNIPEDNRTLITLEMNRRQFAKKTMMASAVLSVSSLPGIKDLLLPGFRTLKKGVMWGCIGFGETIMEKFKAAKAAGFDGVEVMSHLNRSEVLAARDATGLVVPSVCGANHWKFPLSDPDPAIRSQGIEALKLSLEDAAAYGADTVLLVPGRVNEKVTYDECWNRTRDEIKKVLPLAESLKVKIAVENVWNNFLISPIEMVSYIDQFNSPWVGSYFDCGNVLVYGWPEQWIKILGKRIAKIHIKEFSRKIADSQGRSAGFKVNLLEGDVNWPLVMKALDDIGYSGWTTIEQPGGINPEGLKDLCDRLIKIQSS
jgi:L-ribulose-5-phosphate 3-epimerase